MIFRDSDGVVNIEYGHGSVMGFGTKLEESGIHGYSLISTDRHPVGQECKNFQELEGKFDTEVGCSVRFKFLKVESLDILIGDLVRIREQMVNDLGGNREMTGEVDGEHY